MKVLITGANGFIGRNLQLHLRERKDVQVVCYIRNQQGNQLTELLENVDFVFHLAGVNRPQDPNEFTTGNFDFTRDLCQTVASVARFAAKRIPILYASSSQAALENAYGKSKRAAEEALSATGQDPLVPVHVFRLPNVFGKWCRPNYNSVVATFCHNIAHNLPIQINDPHAPLTLVYIDDVVQRFVQIMDGAARLTDTDGFEIVQPQYMTTVGELARQLQAFRYSRNSLVTEPVGNGLIRALYATYVSYLPVEEFSYNVPQYADQRGVFVEMLKTPDCGQFSFFTARPGVTRGGHYHHSKTEKFLVIKGQAIFRFRHMQTGETHDLQTSGETPKIVETVPGWTHDITNNGAEELIVMLWANEIFDRARPDTYDCPV
ncbi:MULTISPECIES: capsular polysaccharide biosynthesis protein CapF [unclassified Herbaspirillum]|uniref:UDP-2-acetamido-2,6-beta-L-arabino-hexul-4-ose reductase n=1 Tax=unclassified Herbaspirillum TaxID=2624150 RepID=UPI00114D6CD7|nr:MULTISPECIES: capsular polysaccharide biosynthesis protein CapF [unclassified Herbaspirillum]MBB5392545.1 UDP-2-acetamido-2,6-beta-L-arabino-hexul-4-ose reductase [Herbaspirillum sp. SJZ102]TQK06182.1 UDP-2-acetamido-2,6-beta-L-arabino-hexul-4-ose reductase [Herbaspirillum sp. SJZ130]TQK12340.1 UDP-2-acetamido-2,6-beta-L-arabino-hexul-4-ose reductase [Herbaspirillum sp. SJZ106]